MSIFSQCHAALIFSKSACVGSVVQWNNRYASEKSLELLFLQGNVVQFTVMGRNETVILKAHTIAHV